MRHTRFCWELFSKRCLASHRLIVTPAASTCKYAKLAKRIDVVHALWYPPQPSEGTCGIRQSLFVACNLCTNLASSSRSSCSIAAGALGSLVAAGVAAAEAVAAAIAVVVAFAFAVTVAVAVPAAVLLAIASAVTVAVASPWRRAAESCVQHLCLARWDLVQRNNQLKDSHSPARASARSRVSHRVSRHKLLNAWACLHPHMHVCRFHGMRARMCPCMDLSVIRQVVHQDVGVQGQLMCFVPRESVCHHVLAYKYPRATALLVRPFTPLR